MFNRVKPRPRADKGVYVVDRSQREHYQRTTHPGSQRQPWAYLRTVHWGVAGYGFILGVLIWIAALRLGIDAIPDFRSPNIVLLVGILSAGVAQTRGRVVIGLAGATVCLGLLIVMYTPFSRYAMRGIVRSDTLRSADAVVVLAADIQANGLLTDKSQASLFHGYQLLCAKYGSRLVVTERIPPEPSCVPAIKLQMQQLKFDYLLDSAGTCENTHDEAYAVAMLARQHGWKTVILVSHPAHMRRAAATFESAGVHVLCSPCPEGRYDITSLSLPDDRLEAFRDWLHEALGYRIYQLRGWI